MPYITGTLTTSLNAPAPQVRPYDVDAFRPAATAATAAAGAAAVALASDDVFATMARSSGRIMLQRGHEGVPVRGQKWGRGGSRQRGASLHRFPWLCDP